MKIGMMLASFALIAACAGPAGADLALELPLDCVMGRDCTVFQYFDHDSGFGRRDYACGTRSYDGHTGTDLRVRDLAHMERGVPVLAAAPGVVRAVRDGMPDADVRKLGMDSVAGREAGNSVVLVHDGGYETQYAHLRRGSVAVRKGQRVEAGQVLGLVGMSGAAAFPHVELMVRRGLVAVDPFTGDSAPRGADGPCTPGEGALWSPAALAALAYSETDVLGAGFAAAAPTKAAIEAGLPPLEHLNPGAPALAFWISLAGVREGDQAMAVVTVPGGKVLARQTKTLDRDQNAFSLFIGGRRAAGAQWPAGVYRGRFELRRKAPDGTWRVVQDVRRDTVVP